MIKYVISPSATGYWVIFGNVVLEYSITFIHFRVDYMDNKVHRVVQSFNTFKHDLGISTWDLNL